MGRYTVKRSNLSHVSDPARRSMLEDRHVIMDVYEDDITLVFYQGTLAVAERRYVDNHINYVIDAAENWCCGIMEPASFDMEERLRA